MAQSRLPPPLEEGQSRTRYLDKCRSASYTPRSPKIGESMADGMSKRAAKQEIRDNKRAREKAYCEAMGKPTTLEDQEFMEDWLNSGELEIPTTEAVLDLNLNETSTSQLVTEPPKAVSPLSALIGPPEPQKMYSPPEPKQQIISVPPPTQHIISSTQPKQQSLSMESGKQEALGGGKLNLNPQLSATRLECRLQLEKESRRRAELRAEERRLEEKKENRLLLEAILSCIKDKKEEKINEKGPGTSSNTTTPTPLLSLVTTPTPNQIDSGKRQSQNLRNKPYYPRAEGTSRQSAGSRIPAAAISVEQHLRAVNARFNSVLESIQAANGEVDEGRIKAHNPDFVQQLLAIDGAAMRLKKTIDTAFFVLNLVP
uniref:Uncharacterized protein n=1 Tax=Meloidogyne javanica TaxID=6303 RepID=A0A915MB11_MELJA